MAQNLSQDSAYITFDDEIDFDELELPSQDEFNQQVMQHCLTSTDENRESLAARLNQINFIVLSDSLDVSLHGTNSEFSDNSINDSL